MNTFLRYPSVPQLIATFRTLHTLAFEKVSRAEKLPPSFFNLLCSNLCISHRRGAVISFRTRLYLNVALTSNYMACSPSDLSLPNICVNIQDPANI